MTTFDRFFPYSTAVTLNLSENTVFFKVNINLWPFTTDKFVFKILTTDIALIETTKFWQILSSCHNKFNTKNYLLQLILIYDTQFDINWRLKIFTTTVSIKWQFWQILCIFDIWSSLFNILNCSRQLMHGKFFTVKGFNIFWQIFCIFDSCHNEFYMQLFSTNGAYFDTSYLATEIALIDIWH